MSAGRFYIDPGRFEPGQESDGYPGPGTRVRIVGGDAHHIRDVLRLRARDVIVVFDGRGCDYRVELDRVGPESVDGHVVEVLPTQTEPSTRVTLVQCLPKGSRMDYIVEKCSELGVACFVPVESERSQRRGVGDARQARWQRLAAAAAAQCGRAVVPEVRRPCGLLDALRWFRAAHPGAPILVPWEAESAISLRRALWSACPSWGDCSGAQPAGRAACVVVGPEGGLTQDEVRSARALGAVTVSLGPRVLRSDTAAVVACSLVLYHLGELGPRPPSGEGEAP